MNSTSRFVLQSLAVTVGGISTLLFSAAFGLMISIEVLSKLATYAI